MPDERMESIREGVGVPPESPAARRADAKRRRLLSHEAPIDEGLGGTTDGETAGDEARMEAALEGDREPKELEEPDEREDRG